MVHFMDFLRLYSKVLNNIITENDVTDEDITLGIQYLKDAYRRPRPSNLSSSIVDFNATANRCAYLFKNASFHTALTYETMSRALLEDPRPFLRTQPSRGYPFKICSLGGGPGSDAIGALAALHDRFGFFHSSVMVVDLMSSWEGVVEAAVTELRSGNYGSFSQQMNLPFSFWSFLTADLMQSLNKSEKSAIKYADLVTMVKFLSSFACYESGNMLKQLFHELRPGALVLSIENAGGGYEELVSKIALECHLRPVLFPLSHTLYYNEMLNVSRFGYESNSSTRVTVQLLIKLQPIQLLNELFFLTQLFKNTRQRFAYPSYIM